MTDKELAEEYVDKLYAEKVSEEIYDKDGWILYNSRDIENAYIAGLKAGRPKWHDVAGGDLPKNEDFVCNQDGLPCWFDIETDQWLDCEGTQIRTTEWCEIPKYEEE